MSSPPLGLVAIGNALVDVLTHADNDFIEKQVKDHGMAKNAMTLIDEARAEELYGEMGAGVEESGGSAGNTMACFASLGGKGGYIGKVADDQLGEVFRHDMKALGVRYETTPLAVGAKTGRCLVLVAEDGHRSMNTYLGAAVEMGPTDVDPQLIADAKVTYLEGYLFDPPQAKEAFIEAGTIVHQNGHKLALTLSDPFCVERHREDFLNLVDHYVDILFANEEEIKSLFQVSSFEEAFEAVKDKCEIAAITRSEKGSVIMWHGEQHEIAAQPAKVVDTTGAGDAYAAGFLYGYTEGLSPEICGEYASIAASEVISHMGPRPEAALANLIAKKAA